MKLVVIAGLISLVVTLLGTPLLIRFLARHGYSQAIRTSTDGIPYPEHDDKRGNPSMGGLAILIALILGYSLSHLRRTAGADRLRIAGDLPDRRVSGWSAWPTTT